METQSVQVDNKGNYSIQLGATKSDGLPVELFCIRGSAVAGSAGMGPPSGDHEASERTPAFTRTAAASLADLSEALEIADKIGFIGEKCAGRSPTDRCG